MNDIFLTKEKVIVHTPQEFAARKLFLVLGIPIDRLDMGQTLDQMEEFILQGRATRKGYQVATVNVDFVVKALGDPELRYLLQNVDLATADGMPIVWAARLLGAPLQGRVAGSDFVPALAERAARKGYSIYFLGAAPGVAEQAAEILKLRFPDLKVAGVYSPPFQPVLEMNPEIKDRIIQAEPDILLVAFGNPKQEKYIGMYGKDLGVPLMIGVGGTLDFIAGIRKRAPLWMQRLGIEWVFRLLQEPRRLWRRYGVDLLVFGSAFARQWLLMRLAAVRSQQSFQIEHVYLKGALLLRLKGAFKLESLSAFEAEARQRVNAGEFLLLDFRETEFIDSSALGTLLELARIARREGGDICFIDVPVHVLRLLRLIKLENFFIVFENLELAQEQIRRWGRGGAWKVPTEVSYLPEKKHTDNAWVIVKTPRSFDATTAEEFFSHCAKILHTQPFLIVDLSDTVFLASAGLATLARLARLVEKFEGELRIAGATSDVIKVIRLARFDKVFSIYPDIQAALAATSLDVV